MSRHRDFHGINQRYHEYDDGYDDYEECTGTSLTDSCVSPGTAAQFTFNRDRRNNQFADFLRREEENEIAEEPTDILDSYIEDQFIPQNDFNSSFEKPKLTDDEHAKLLSCMDAIRDVMGEDIPDGVVTKVIIDSQYDSEKALNTLLEYGCKDSSGKSGGAGAEMSRQLQAVVMKPPAVETSRADKGSQKQSKAVPKLAAFQIGDSYDETETRLLESTSQLSLKSQNGASSKKEPKTPINAQLKGVKALIEAEGTRSPSLSRSSSKSKLERLDASAEYEKRSEQGKELINLVVIGHVDAGKSTLMGHVLYQLGVVSQRQMHRFEMDSKKLGKASFMYAWVLDETEEERNRGVTMDVAQTRFETSTRIINLLDAPGHKDFIPNMITGAAQADCALLVVNATNGEFETGFELGGQTREHTILIRSLGVSQLVVAINKMDTVNWSQTRFLEIASKLSVFLKQTGFKDADIQYIPCSGLNGVNIVKPATNLPAFSWYTGKPLIQEIENFKPPERLVNKPLRMCVQDIFKGMSGSFSVAGRMEAGDIQNGDRVLVMPSAEYATVKGILIDEGPEKIGFAGDTVTLQLLGIDIQKVHVGCVLCDPASPVPVVTRLKARLIIFNLEVPITQGYPVVYHSQSLNEPANISKLISKLHKSTAEVLKRKPRCLTKNSTAVVEITLARPQCVELYRDFKDLGRFMLRSEGHTIAAGIVMEICPNKN
ncbi:HBS1-like protein isoform X3 [Watersipora subatra]|uniref:HBS1-like protein isoform X3 n=1 Tax=Watersipora subatra TaxID=2589382 RepID=UPI00355C5517